MYHCLCRTSIFIIIFLLVFCILAFLYSGSFMYRWYINHRLVGSVGRVLDYRAGGCGFKPPLPTSLLHCTCGKISTYKRISLIKHFEHNLIILFTRTPLLFHVHMHVLCILIHVIRLNTCI